MTSPLVQEVSRAAFLSLVLQPVWEPSTKKTSFLRKHLIGSAMAVIPFPPSWIWEITKSSDECSVSVRKLYDRVSFDAEENRSVHPLMGVVTGVDASNADREIGVTSRDP